MYNTITQSTPTSSITTDNLVAKLITSTSSTPKTNATTPSSPHVVSQPSVISSSGSSGTRANRLMSNASSTYTMQSVKLSAANATAGASEFRIMAASNQSERSTTSGGTQNPGTQSANNAQNNQLKMMQHLPDAVDVVKLNFEGQRRVVVAGYMTSADILRNMLLKNSAGNSNGASSGFDVKPGADMSNVAPLIVKRQNNSAQMSLKEKLLMQQQQNKGESYSPMPQQNQNQYQRIQQHAVELNNHESRMPEQGKANSTVRAEDSEEKEAAVCGEDDDLAKKFARKSRTRSMSGLVTLDLLNNQNTQIIDIDFDYETKPQSPQAQQGVTCSKIASNPQTVKPVQAWVMPIFFIQKS